jgi:4-carboxymuconolactone decarboxylase
MHDDEAAFRPRELAPEGGWTGAPLRLPPPAQPRGVLFRTLARLARIFGRPQVPDVFTVLHLHPRLFWPWLWFASRLMPRGHLAARDRERLILRTAWNCRCRYEWAQHVDLALRIGLTDADILRVARDTASCADEHERILLQACDELTQAEGVSEATWTQLAQRYDEKSLIEILMLIGHYRMLAGFLNTAGLRLEALVEERLAAFHRRIATEGTLT